MKFNTTKIFVMFGLASYLSVCTFNNFIDKHTNQILLQNMFTMKLLFEDPVLGKGLLERAIYSQQMPIITLNIIIIVEALISLLLWHAGFQLVSSIILESMPYKKAIAICNLAITCFMCLWFFFWCGGLWFGYWIKTGQIQTVHMSLIMISILILIFLNIHNSEIE